MKADLHMLTGAYALDALPVDERPLFEEHRAQCDACRREVAELQITATRLGDLLEQAPPGGLKRCVLSEVDRTRQESPFGRRTGDGHGRAPTAVRNPRDEVAVRRTSGAWGTRLLAPAAAVMAILVVGLSLLVTGMSERIDDLEIASTELAEVLAAPDLESVTAEGPQGSLARVVMSEAKGEAVFVAQGMAPAPDQHTYELWLIDEGQARSAGRFDVDDSGRVAQSLRGDLQQAAAIAVTVEPAGGSPAPTTDPVMRIELEDA